MSIPITPGTVSNLMPTPTTATKLQTPPSSSPNDSPFNNLINNAISSSKEVDHIVNQVALGTADPLQVAPKLSEADLTIRTAQTVITKGIQAVNETLKTPV